MAEVKKITLGMENCEVWEFERKDIGDMDCVGIRRSVSRIGCNCIKDYTECDEFFLELFSSANVARETPFHDGPKLPFDRITECADIVSVEITYDNGATEDIWVPSDCDYNVSATTQTCYLSKCGNLYIRISEKGDVQERLNLDKVDDAKYMDFKRKTCT